MTATLGKGNGTKASSLKKPAYSRRLTRKYLVLPPLLYGVKKAAALLEQWVKYRAASFLEVEYLFSDADQKDTRHCPYHRKKGHMLEQSITF